MAYKPFDLTGKVSLITGGNGGIGLGMAEPGTPAGGAFFRLAHMGHVNAHMVLGALATMEAGMCALDITHGAGALDAAAGALAQAAIAR